MLPLEVAAAGADPAALVGSGWVQTAAVPDVTLTGKPQSAIVPLAYTGRVAVSPGCTVSRVRTGQPAEVMTCAVRGTELEGLVRRLEASTTSDRLVREFAIEDRARHAAPA